MQRWNSENILKHSYYEIPIKRYNKNDFLTFLFSIKNTLHRWKMKIFHNLYDCTYIVIHNIIYLSIYVEKI